jgi:hypothetical protein
LNLVNASGKSPGKPEVTLDHPDDDARGCANASGERPAIQIKAKYSAANVARERGDRPARHHQVVVRVHQTAVGAQSRAPIEADFWFVHTLRGGQATRLDMFSSKAQAFKAAGLSH